MTQRRPQAQRAKGARRQLLFRVMLTVVVVAMAVGFGLLSQDRHPSSAGNAPVVAVESPSSGARVRSPATFRFRVTNGRLGDPSTGLDHLHVSLDGAQPVQVTTDVVTAGLAPGQHMLWVQVADATHEGIARPVTETFTVAGAR